MRTALITIATFGVCAIAGFMGWEKFSEYRYKHSDDYQMCEQFKSTDDFLATLGQHPDGSTAAFCARVQRNHGRD
jgi:hypothetical protein